FKEIAFDREERTRSNGNRTREVTTKAIIRAKTGPAWAFWRCGAGPQPVRTSSGAKRGARRTRGVGRAGKKNQRIVKDVSKRRSKRSSVSRRFASANPGAGWWHSFGTA